MERTLVIANACFSKEEANGRTLENLFSGANKENLAQFFVYGNPDFHTCSRYYQISDKDALKAVFSFTGTNGEVKEKKDAESNTLERYQQKKVEKLPHKTPFKVLARECIWKLSERNRYFFWKWLEDFEPQVVFLFIANNTFLIRLAIQVAKKYKIPIVMYTTEGYNFMDFNYFTNKPSIIYRLYYLWLSKAYRDVAAYIKRGFFNNTLLRDDYQQMYDYPCECIMNSSSIDYAVNTKVVPYEDMQIAYLGNLGLGRHKALIEVAGALQKIDECLHLDVYGMAPDENVVGELRKCKGIRYYGLIPYEEVVKVIHDSNLLVHAELNDPIVTRDLKYAFSTKIADSVCSGTPFFVYANASLAETVFLRETECAFIANDQKDLKQVLLQALQDEEARKTVVTKAGYVREKYMTGNSALMQSLS